MLTKSKPCKMALLFLCDLHYQAHFSFNNHELKTFRLKYCLCLIPFPDVAAPSISIADTMAQDIVSPQPPAP
jgi:hypothetical protein